MVDCHAQAVTAAVDAMAAVGSALTKTDDDTVRSLGAVATLCEIADRDPETHRAWVRDLSVQHIVKGKPLAPDHVTLKAVMKAGTRAGALDRKLSQRASDYAKALAYWRSTKLPAENFVEQIEQIRGLRAAITAGRRLSKPVRTKRDRDAMRLKLLRECEPGQPIQPGPITEGLDGFYIAAIRVQDGKPVLLAVTEQDEKRVDAYLNCWAVRMSDKPTMEVSDAPYYDISDNVTPPDEVDPDELDAEPEDLREPVRADPEYLDSD